MKSIKFLLLIFCFVVMPAIASNVVIDSDKQSFDHKTSTLNFMGNVNVKMDNITIKSPKASATVDAKGQISTAVFSQGAKAIQDNITSKNELHANIINMSLIEKQIKAQGNVKSIVNDASKPIVSISANVQEFDTNTNIMSASGNVIINYKDIKTSSQNAKITINTDGNLEKVKIYGNANILQGKHTIKANTFTFSPSTNNMSASGNTYSETILDTGEVVKIKSDYQKYNKNKNTLITTGNVKINYQGYTATGSKAIFMPDANKKKFNKVVFEGRSKIQESNREIEADNIEMTLNPRGFSAQGNVRSYFKSVKGLDKTNK